VIPRPHSAQTLLHSVAGQLAVGHPESSWPASRLGFVERPGVGPQADLVDHHRRHRDGVAARPRPLWRPLSGHALDLVEELGRAGRDLVDLSRQQVTYIRVWHPGYLRVSGAGAFTQRRGTLAFR
jgi:hypothetical protein